MFIPVARGTHISGQRGASRTFQKGQPFARCGWLRGNKATPFSTVDGSVRWIVPDDRLTLMAWGRNLSDEATLATQATLPSGRAHVSYSPPRTYGITVGAKF